MQRVILIILLVFFAGVLAPAAPAAAQTGEPPVATEALPLETGDAGPAPATVTPAEATAAQAGPLAPTPSRTAMAFGISIPLPGHAAQGVTSIQGDSALQGFARAEISFAYIDAPETWFLIAESSTPVENGVLAQWDTTTITDGNYTLRLIVWQMDGSQQSALVEGVRVRNYSPIETDTPTPLPPATQSMATPQPTATVTPTPTVTPIPPTATALPPNPAELSMDQGLDGMGKGILAAAGLFAASGVYYQIRRIRRRDRRE